MLSKRLHQGLNDQIKNEFYSAYLYLAMSAHAETNNMPGTASWLKLQSHEEWTHGMKFYAFLMDRGARVTFQAIQEPPATYASLLEMFEQVLAHEKKVTQAINRLYELALSDKDYPSQVMLQWFINEQVEEEKNATQIIERLKMIPEKSGSIFYLDHELGKRAKE
jgi:ferritin